MPIQGCTPPQRTNSLLIQGVISISNCAPGNSSCHGIIITRPTSTYNLWYLFYRTRAVWRVSSHSEYLENRSHGSQSQETLLCIREKSLSRGASQSAVRCHWLSLCIVWPWHSQISSLSTAIFALGKARSCRQPNLGCRMGRHFVVMKLICSLCHCECDSHTVHKVSQRRLTADWLAPRESDCSQMHREVSSDWLPSYITAMRPVLEILKMAGYFLGSPHTCLSLTSRHRSWDILKHNVALVVCSNKISNEI